MLVVGGRMMQLGMGGGACRGVESVQGAIQ